MTFALLRDLDLLLYRLANGEPFPLGVDQQEDEPLPLHLNQKNDRLSSKRLLSRKPSIRSSRALIPYLITASYLIPFSIGVAVTLAWQSYRMPSTDRQLAAVRQSVDQLTAKVQQISGDIAAQQAILRRVAAPLPLVPPALRRSIN